jgi:hypothetical protein
MKTEMVYPLCEKKKIQRCDVIAAAKWPFLLAAYVCVIVNATVGGKAWSIVVLWSLWIAWSLIVSPSMIEYNRISQVIKLITYACILLILIDVLLSPGWAMLVVPIICFSGLMLSAVLFFTDFERQKQNIMPMLLLAFISIISAAVGLIVLNGEHQWALVVMGALALAILAACFMTLRSDFVRTLQKRFHTK